MSDQELVDCPRCSEWASWRSALGPEGGCRLCRPFADYQIPQGMAVEYALIGHTLTLKLAWNDFHKRWEETSWDAFQREIQQ